jgi:hypothetical protein
MIFTSFHLDHNNYSHDLPFQYEFISNEMTQILSNWQPVESLINYVMRSLELFRPGSNDPKQGYSYDALTSYHY